MQHVTPAACVAQDGFCRVREGARATPTDVTLASECRTLRDTRLGCKMSDFKKQVWTASVLEPVASQNKLVGRNKLQDVACTLGGIDAWVCGQKEGALNNTIIISLGLRADCTVHM